MNVAMADTGGGGGGFPSDLFTITGSPGSIEASAKRYDTFAALAVSESTTLGTKTLSSWTGSEGDLYRQRVAEYPPMLKAAGAAFAELYLALVTFADTMTTQQSAMSTLRARAEAVWQQLQHARSALATEQASLASATASLTQAATTGEATAAGARMATAQAGVSSASATVGRLESEWEECCRQARAIHALMVEAAQRATSRVTAVESPGAVPPPSVGGAVASLLGVPLSPLTPLPAELTSPGEVLDAAKSGLTEAGKAAQKGLVNELLANSWYSSLWGAPLEVVNQMIKHPGIVPPWMRGVLPGHQLPTFNSLDEYAKAFSTWGKADLARAQGLLSEHRLKLADLSRISRDQPLNVWNDLKLVGNSAFVLPFRQFDVASSALTKTVAQLTHGATMLGRLPTRVLGPLDSFITLVNPSSTGTTRAVDRTMAGINLLGTAAAESAPLLANVLGVGSRAAVFIPGVGEVVAAGTGAYLAGRWLYDNYQPAQKTFDAVGHFATEGGSALVHGDWDRLGSEAGKMGAEVGHQLQNTWNDAKGLPGKASELADKVGDDIGNAWNKVTSIF